MLRFIVSVIFSSLGCLLQLYYITSSYLCYTSNTQVVIVRGTMIKPPDILYCVREAEYEKGENITKISEIFDILPSFESIVDNYLVNNEESSAGNSSNVTNLFNT